MPEGDEFAAQGAQLKCNQTQVPAPGTFNCVNPLHQIGGRFVGTELDFIPMFNVLPFPAPCKILSAAAAGTPVPCVPFPTPWQGVHTGFISLGRKLLLNSSYSFCTFGGKIEFSSSGQSVASLGNVSTFAAAPAPVLPAGKVLVLAPGDKATGWNTELNKVPLEANAKYLVGTCLYETDTEGRVAKTRGVLTLRPHDRNEKEQGDSVRKKDGKPNPDYVPDARTDLEKRKQLAGGAPNPAYRPDTRSSLQKRESVDDGGHLRGAQFDGAGEQINYVAQHMDLNQKRKGVENWFKMEENWARELKKIPPSHVYTETALVYPKTIGSSINNESMRPSLIRTKYWINGKDTTKRFPQ